MKLKAPITIFAIVALCPIAEAKDLGLFYGEPTPAFAMYTAQANAAAENCEAAGLIGDEKYSAKFMKHFNNSTEVKRYSKKDAEFAANYEMFHAKYKTAWDAATPEVREHFCSDYNEDVAVKVGKGLTKFAVQVMYFRYTFSPKTEESLARARKWIGILSVGSAVATTAATVSAGRDSVAAAKAGDWATSNQLMADSRNFNNIGAGMVALSGEAATASESTPLISVLDTQGSSGESQVVRCPVVDHFFAYTAPIESSVWTTYMSVHMACRQPTPSDLQRM